MRKARLVISILSIIFSGIITFQSSLVGLGNTLSQNGEISGSAGVFLGFCMLVAGIIGVCTTKGYAGGYTSSGFYIFGGLLGIANSGSYSDLVIWSVMSFAFACVFIIGSNKTKKMLAIKNRQTTDVEN